MLRLNRRLEWAALVAVLILAAAMRLYQLDRLPAGFNNTEIDTLRIVESLSGGHVSVFYSLRALPDPGHAVLFPLIETVMTALFGSGLWSYRLIPALAGLLGVVFTYAAARRLVGFWSALIAALCMAVGLWPVILSRLAIGQTLLVPVMAAALWLVACAVHVWDARLIDRRASTITYGALSLVLTLGLYSGDAGLFVLLIPIGFLTYLLMQRRREVIAQALSYGGFAIVITLALCLPYLATTFRLPEESAIGAYWVARPLSIGDLIRRFGIVITSAVSGASLPSLLLTLPVVALFAWGIVRIWRGRRISNNMLLLLALAAGLIPPLWFGRGGFDLAGAFPPIAIGIGVGAVAAVEWLAVRLAVRWRVFRRRATRRTAFAGLVALLIAGAVAGLSAGLQTEFFVRWSVDSAVVAPYHTALGHVADYLNTVTDSLPTVICTPHLVSTPDYPLPDSTLLMRMTRRTTINWRFADCDHVAILADGGNAERVIFADPSAVVSGGGSTNSTSDRSPTVPPAYRGWIVPGTPILPIVDAPGMFVTLVNVAQSLDAQLGQVMQNQAFWPPGAQIATDPLPLPVQMGDYLHFEGYTLNAALNAGRIYHPGQFIPLVTYWRIDGQQLPDVRIFAHVLVDPDSPPALQNDVPDLLPAYLHDRDIVIQNQAIQIPYPFPEGTYYLSIGAYHASPDGQVRVPVYDANGQIRDDRLFLGTITIRS